MDLPAKVLSDLIVHSKYARWWGELGRRETFEEVVARDYQMLQDQLDSWYFAPGERVEIRNELRDAFRQVHQRKILPAMRALQFAGAPIERDNNRIYNCGFMHARRPAFFKELMFLLLGGSGIGYSVQYHHVAQLPRVRDPGWSRRYIVQDSVVGWADAVDALVKAFFFGAPDPAFDFQEVRPKGTVLKTSGGLAPGPEKLEKALGLIREVLQARRGQHLRPIDVHDIACHIADCVVSGGIRRSAMIALFSPSDRDMLTCKSQGWYDRAPQRAMANNSVVLVRGQDEHLFHQIFDELSSSQSGEPGFFWTSDPDWGTNPCAEIALRDMQFCNLTTINVSDVQSQSDLNERAWGAAIIGTVQATFTDFHYLDPGWRETTERDRLVGVSMTGIASGRVLDLDLIAAADSAKAANAWASRVLGIRPAARVTTIKPEGTASLVVNSSSGIHAWHAPFYIRRIRFQKSEAVARYLLERLPYRAEHDPEFPFPLEDVVGDPDSLMLAIPIRAPEGAVVRNNQSPLELLDDVLRVTRDWVHPGHRSGANRNNVSTTVSVRPEEWEQVRAWMWRNRDDYSGIALLPYDGGDYVQPPYQEISEDTYQLLASQFVDIDVTQIDESSDYTNLAGEAACAGGACEVTFL